VEHWVCGENGQLNALAYILLLYFIVYKIVTVIYIKLKTIIIQALLASKILFSVCRGRVELI
jgi:hypothetical protein